MLIVLQFLHQDIISDDLEDIEKIITDLNIDIKEEETLKQIRKNLFRNIIWKKNKQII